MDRRADASRHPGHRRLAVQTDERHRLHGERLQRVAHHRRHHRALHRRVPPAQGEQSVQLAARQEGHRRSPRRHVRAQRALLLDGRGAPVPAQSGAGARVRGGGAPRLPHGERLAVGGRVGLLLPAVRLHYNPQRAHHSSGAALEAPPTRTSLGRHRGTGQRRECDGAAPAVARGQHAAHRHAADDLLRLPAHDAADERRQHRRHLLQRLQERPAARRQVPPGAHHHRAADVREPFDELLPVLRHGAEVPAPARLDGVLREAPVPTVVGLRAQSGDAHGQSAQREVAEVDERHGSVRARQDGYVSTTQMQCLTPWVSVGYSFGMSPHCALRKNICGDRFHQVKRIACMVCGG